MIICETARDGVAAANTGDCPYLCAGPGCVNHTTSLFVWAGSSQHLTAYYQNVDMMGDE